MGQNVELALVFVLEGQKFAVPVRVVTQALRAVAVTPLPKAPAVVLGVIDFHGEIVPVMDIRLRLGLPPRAPALSDQIIITRTPRLFAFAVENIEGVVEWDGVDFVAAQTVVPGVEFLDGVVHNREGLILVYDLDAFFLAEEFPRLDRAVEQLVDPARVHG